ncbi:MAG: bifunctional diaminohydroxyphosphoribosylaminopyrimidine deaminase/5-amino-6-(5-phosphoribosylamino)uracil reductase RibD [Myxococcales bacterium]|nr:bifunctional diaminohydroxyphosphoribosylaminopyrimidine deaminase/5-amino-6-(5-phosphoribosylamino)uracil reductase RibD [Myxococcales bacterium]
MRLALDAASTALGRTAPNPAVGCVLLDSHGQLVSVGYHARAGTAHAEVHALAQAGGRAAGGTAVVTLEPCNHTGRTGPCTEALLAAGIRRVVYGTVDPNPIVAGRGLARLREAGVEIVGPTLPDECERLIMGFRTWVLTRRPRVTVKLAASLDGRIATASGESQWITGPAARADVHGFRDCHDAILVGAETVRRDDPSLTARLEAPRDDHQPRRLVVTTRPRSLAASLRLFGPTLAAGTTVAAPAGSDASHLSAGGATIWALPADERGVSLEALLDRAGADGLTSLWVEGGGRLVASLLARRLVDAVVWYVAPRFIGGDGLPALGPLALSVLADSPRLVRVRVTPLGDDLRIDGDVDYMGSGYSTPTSPKTQE